MKINYCSICWNPSNHPLGITFDEKNICSGCIVHNERYSINWSQRKKQIKKYLAKTTILIMTVLYQYRVMEMIFLL